MIWTNVSVVLQKSSRRLALRKARTSRMAVMWTGTEKFWPCNTGPSNDQEPGECVHDEGIFWTNNTILKIFCKGHLRLTWVFSDYDVGGLERAIVSCFTARWIFDAVSANLAMDRERRLQLCQYGIGHGLRQVPITAGGEAIKSHQLLRHPGESSQPGTVFQHTLKLFYHLITSNTREGRFVSLCLSNFSHTHNITNQRRSLVVWFLFWVYSLNTGGPSIVRLFGTFQLRDCGLFAHLFCTMSIVVENRLFVSQIYINALARIHIFYNDLFLCPSWWRHPASTTTFIVRIRRY